MKDANSVAIHNGTFLGLDHSPGEAEALIIPVPWDVTTSYRAGTVHGPESVIEASYQLDLYSPYLKRLWERKIATLPLPLEWKNRSQSLRKLSAKYIEFLEQGGSVEESREMIRILDEVNSACRELSGGVHARVSESLERDQHPLLLGGDHSVSLGSIRACAEKFNGLSIFHVDAHADLREAYEGFEESHASIMFNAMASDKIAKLVQVGLRDVCQEEVNFIQGDSRIESFFDWDLQARLHSGETWRETCQEIVRELGRWVYVSFDIDGLDPKLCPHTGTPVPGGLEFAQAVSLLQEVVRSGRVIVGADLVEVAPSATTTNDWDGNVGARVLMQLLIAILQTNERMGE
ncbi:MAG: agmatinase [Bdellovibrio sp.]|nr:MAG: agmatinase [Bdellovibrio sp.]